MLLLAPRVASAQTHFDECATRTGNNAHLLIPADVVAKLGGSPLSSDDEVAAFTPEGMCAGAIVWKSGPKALTIWGDDSFTQAKESFLEGEEIELVVWDASSGREYRSVTVTLVADLPFYGSDLAYSKDALFLLEDLVVNVSQQAPTVESPLAGARAVDINPVLRWMTVDGEATYEVQLATDADFDPVAFEVTDVKGGELQVNSLKEGTTYHWRVRAVTAGVAGEYVSSSFTTYFAQTLELAQGWNLISGRIDPKESEIDEIYSDLTSDILMVKDGLGQLYSPEFSINTIGSWAPSQGYHVYAKAAGSLELKGDEVPLETPLPLAKGWNTVAYWPSASLDAPSALASIASNVVVVKNGAGQVWLPEFNVNTMGPMQPGAGYLVHLAKASNLLYPTDGASKSGVGDAVALKTNQASIGANATLLVLAPELENGARIVAKRSAGTIIGEGEVRDGHAVIILHGDDDITPDVQEGALPGESITVELLADNTSLRVEQYRDLLSGAMTGQLEYRTDGAWVAEAAITTEPDALPRTFELEQNYPNPFNPSTRISYVIPEDAHVRLEVWNVLGQRVRTLVNEVQAADRYQVEFDAEGLPSGVYFYTLGAGTHKAVRQMMLLK